MCLRMTGLPRHAARLNHLAKKGLQWLPSKASQGATSKTKSGRRNCLLEIIHTFADRYSRSVKNMGGPPWSSENFPASWHHQHSSEKLRLS